MAVMYDQNHLLFVSSSGVGADQMGGIFVSQCVATLVNYIVQVKKLAS